MVLAVTFAMAQNTATINQTGNNNTSPVVQTGDLNVTTVDQVTGANYVAVEQSGLRNEATAVQNGSFNGVSSIPNWGYVNQNGNDNKAFLREGVLGGATSYGADGFIDQTGNTNYAELNIVGEYHNFIDHGITQIQESGAPGNTAVINQSSFNNDMDVYQIGSGNLTTGTTNGQNNQFFVDQDGVGNTATVSQNGDGNGEFGYDWGWNHGIRNWNILSQKGEDNVGHVIQGNNNIFKMEQWGDRNIAKADQGDNTTLKTLQNGDDNLIGGMVDCTPTEWVILDNGASLDATQLGNWNKLWVSTAGSLTVVQDNTGTAMVGNTIKYTQTAAGSVALTQDGDANLIWLKNTSTADPMDVDIDQIGDGNVVASFENGVATDCARFAGAHLDIYQLGNYNALHLNSAGALDVVDVMQNGSNNWASIIQSGN